MSKSCFPTPTIAPFHRLYVYDSLMMNAQRWSLAHDYHRRRQNVHYQALNQPGIVCGLGVRLIDAPESTEARFRDQRWIEIQPGMAIDVEGNVIVVDPKIDRCYRIAAKAPTIGTITVYVVVSYVEPEKPLYQHPPETLQEQFRFDQKTTPPAPHEVELCRIQIGSDFIQLQHPQDVFFPKQNQLDLRYRQQAQIRPLTVVTAAQVGETSSYYQGSTQANLSAFMRSVSALYPPLQGDPKIGQVTLQLRSNATEYDLLYLTDSQLLQSSANELDALKKYLSTGGVILIETAPDTQKVSTLIDCITQQLETPLQTWKEMQNHPLRSQPFLFANLPTIAGEIIHLWNGGGVILVSGNLSAAWGGDEALNLCRNEIRSAQELGINILNFAYCCRHMTRLLQSDQ